jgi:hypothetical protein
LLRPDQGIQAVFVTQEAKVYGTEKNVFNGWKSFLVSCVVTLCNIHISDDRGASIFRVRPYDDLNVYLRGINVTETLRYPKTDIR